MRPTGTKTLAHTRWRIRLAGAVLLGCVLGVVYAASRPPARPEVLTSMTLEVEGLDCPLWCPIRIDRALAPLPGIFDLRVDVRRGRVDALLDPERTKALEVAAALTKAGWQVHSPVRPQDSP